MKENLVKRIEKLEVKAKPAQWVSKPLFKFAMDYRRDPEARKRGKLNPDYKIKEPDPKTCREYGQRNVEVVKEMRLAISEGKEVVKIVRSFL
jgi:hypothetical protein